MTDLFERVQAYSNLQLFKMIQEPDDYQAEAVAIAQEVWKARQVSEEEIQHLKTIITSEKAEKASQEQEKQAQYQAIVNYLKQPLQKFITNLNPFLNDRSTPERYIKTLVLFFGFNAIREFFPTYSLISYTISYNESGWDISTLLYILPLLVLSTGTVLLTLHKKNGWILIAIYTTFIATVDSYYIWDYLWNSTSYFSKGLTDLVTSTSIPNRILTLILYSAILWLICKASVRAIFNITKETMWLTILTAVALTIFILQLMN